MCLAGTGHKVKRVFMERSWEHLQDPQVTQGRLGFEETKARVVNQENQAIQECLACLA